MQVYVFETKPFKILPFSTHNADQKAIKNSSSCMFNANTIPSWSYVSHICVRLYWVQKTPNTLENRNFIRYNLRIFTRIIILSLKSEKIRAWFSIGRKNNILIKKDIIFLGCHESKKTSHQDGIDCECYLWSVLDPKPNNLCAELLQSFTELRRCHLHYFHRSGHVQFHRQSIHLRFREPEIQKQDQEPAMLHQVL